MIDLELFEDEFLALVQGMRILMKVAEDNRRLEEAYMWEDIIRKFEERAKRQWIYADPQNLEERAPSPPPAG